MYKEIIRQYSDFLKYSQKENDIHYLSHTTKFVDNLSNWLEDEDSGLLPKAFAPLFEKSIEIVKKLSFLSPSTILQFDPKDEEKVLDFEEEILLFIIGKSKNKQTEEILKCAVEYANFSDLKGLRQSYLLWSALGITLFNEVCRNYGFSKSGKEVILKRTINDYDWPWQYHPRTISQYKWSRHLQCGLIIPLSWHVEVWLIFNMLATYEKGPFFKKEQTCNYGIDVSQELLKFLIDENNGNEIIFTEFSPSPLSIPIIIVANNDFVSIKLTEDCSDFKDLLIRFLPLLSTTEDIIDFYLYKIKSSWDYLRKETDRDAYLSKDPVLLKKIFEFIGHSDIEKYAKHDTRLKKELSALDNIIDAQKDEEELVDIFKKTKRLLNKFRRIERGDEGPGRPQTPELSAEHIEYLVQQLPKVNELYNKFKLEQKSLQTKRLEVTNKILISKVTSYCHHTFASLPATTMQKILENATIPFLAESTKRREDFRLSLLHDLLKAKFEIDSDQIRLKGFLQSQSNLKKP